MDFENISWDIIDLYFKDNPSVLVDHHLKSYNDFFEKGMYKIFKEKNPISFFKDQNKKTNKFKYECKVYMGGLEGTRIYIGKPVIYDKNGEINRKHFMYPNEARLRNLSYTMSIHYDVDIEYVIRTKGPGGEDLETKKLETLEKIYLGNFPIMLRSKLCLLNGLTKDVRHTMGECRNDLGGYFIIDGKEKLIVSQERFADNNLIVKDKFNDMYSHSVDIRSVSEDISKPVRTLSVRMVTETPSLTNNNIVVVIPNVRKPIPLFILMRALGVLSDKEIIETCILDMERYDYMVELFRPCIHDASILFNQVEALKYIGTHTKGKTVNHAMEILMNYLLPHIGELNFKQKAYYIGYMVKKLLLVYTKKEKPTDRDSYRYKRLETSGILIKDLFKEYYNLQLKNIYLKIDKEHFYHRGNYQGEHFMGLILYNRDLIFKDKIVESGFKTAFKGNWGSTAHTKRLGALQDLSRLSFFSTICQLRKTNIPISADGAKIVSPRKVQGTQWGNFCPIHSPDGGNVGFHKHLTISTKITTHHSGYPYITLLRQLGMELLETCTPQHIELSVKLFVNGAWVGITRNPKEIIETLKLYRRNNKINIYTSILWDISKKEIWINTDAGRLCHPVYYMYNGKISFGNTELLNKLKNKTLTWNHCIYGLNEPGEPTDNSIKKIKQISDNKSCIIEYIDSMEADGIIMAKFNDKLEDYTSKNISHAEIHPSFIFSVMANQVIHLQNNPYPRSAFSCGQGKQAVSMYSTNVMNRIDKSGIVLNYGQNPLIKSRYLKYITNDEHAYGENAIVAIMCYSGYNTEDAVIINEGFLKRGGYRTTYYNMYEETEKEETVGDVTISNNFVYIDSDKVIGLKPGCNYSYLDKETGIIKENTEIDDKTIIIGKVSVNSENPGEMIDSSKKPKKGQKGFVDKSFITTNSFGKKIAKIRVRDERIPAIGDKFCSRAGQKGTVGIVMKECDMPITKEGLIPDIIVNPHAMPSRMTIGHLVESQQAKVCALYGAYGDCTPFINIGPKDKEYGEMLVKQGFHSSGTEFLMNGMTGEQMETSIYIGPTYYLRLKHMVKDKINHRSRGPRNQLTRQTVGGRANDGGLRIGEMDRDCLIAHGMSHFIKDSMLERGDKYYMAICNKSGCVSIYNKSKNIFISPMVDGPIKFVDVSKYDANIVNISKFGRDFSIVKVPYAFKLLMQELQAMNVHMRIVTDKNVDQLLSIKGGDDIKTLTGLESYDDIVAVINKIKAETMNEKDTEKDKMRKEFTPIEAAKVHLLNEGDHMIWDKDTLVGRRWIIKSIDDEANTVTLETNNLVGLTSNFMTVDASELKHGKTNDFVSELLNDDGWGNIQSNDMQMNKVAYDPFGNVVNKKMIPENIDINIDIDNYEETPPSISMSSTTSSPKSPDYNPYYPPGVVPTSPDYDPNNPQIPPPPQQEKTKTIAEEKKEQDKEEMPLLNAVEDKEGDGSDDDEGDEFSGFQRGVSIKKIN